MPAYQERPNQFNNMDTNNRLSAVGPQYRRESQEKTELKNDYSINEENKLIVYRENEKKFITQAAAYALGLADVRSVMIDEGRYYEIDDETIEKLEKERELKIEYKKLDRSKNPYQMEYDLDDMLSGLSEGGYGIGVHGIDKGTPEEKRVTAESITNEGLDINNNGKTILSTAVSLGTNENMEAISEEIKDYKYGYGERANVVLAVPLAIKNENGEMIYLGFPEKNKKTVDQEYQEHCILDIICSKMRGIPKEFILGYFMGDKDGSFVANDKHYSKLSKEEKEVLFSELEANMDDVCRSYNELIKNGNIAEINTKKELLEQRGIKTFIEENAIDLVLREKEHKLFREKGEEKRRDILIDKAKEEEITSRTELESEENLDNKSQNKVRRVLVQTKEDSEKENVEEKQNREEDLESKSQNKVRRVLVQTKEDSEKKNTEDRQNNGESEVKAKNKRREILIDAVNNTKLSDLTKAKEILQEGIEVNKEELNKEGRDV